MQNTVNSIAFGEDSMELMEGANKEEGKELNEKLEFISYYFFHKSKLQSNLLDSYKPYYHISSYNSPIKSVLTPPPNFSI